MGRKKVFGKKFNQVSTTLFKVSIHTHTKKETELKNTQFDYEVTGYTWQ